MSKQLAISASGAVFAMAAFALFASPLGELSPAAPSMNQQGATTEVAAPSIDRAMPALFDLIG